MFKLVELKKAIRQMADLVQHQLPECGSGGFRCASFRLGCFSA